MLSFRVKVSVSFWVRVRVRVRARLRVRVTVRIRVRLGVRVSVMVRVRKKRICTNFMKCFCANSHVFLRNDMLLFQICPGIVINENSLPFLCRSFTLKDNHLVLKVYEFLGLGLGSGLVLVLVLGLG